MASVGIPHASVPRPARGAGLLQDVLLGSGALASIIYMAADVISARRLPGYSLVNQAISELSAQGVATAPLWSRLMMLFGIFYLLFVVGLFRASRGNRPLRVAARVMLAFGILAPVLWSLVPMHQRGAPFGWQDAGHIAVGAACVLTITAFISIAASGLGPAFRRYSLATAAVVLIAGGASFLYVPRMIAQEPTPWLGVIERASLYAYYLWMAVLAAALIRRRNAG